MTGWIIFSGILGFIWFCLLCVGTWYFLYNPENDDKETHLYNFRIYAALMAAGLIFVVAHWIVLLLAVPVFFVYGLWAGARLMITKPWKETAE